MSMGNIFKQQTLCMLLYRLGKAHLTMRFDVPWGPAQGQQGG